MTTFKKTTPRIDVKFIDSDTEEILFEINNRNWMNLGELFTNNTANSIIDNELGGNHTHKNIMIMAIGEYTKVND
jgi:5-methylcytosine-specific restriction endonuclease McrA